MRLALPLALLLAAVPASAQEECDDITELNYAYFGFERVGLSDDAVERLEENANVLDLCPEIGVLVTGWGDRDEPNAEALSLLRAAAVAEWYLARGLSPDRIAARGGGEDPYSSPEEDPGPGDARSRRAESDPLPIGDLPADAFDWRRAAAVREDPAPLTIPLADGAFLTFDWALTDDVDCPDGLPGDDGTPELMLASATLEVDGEVLPLDTTCRGSTWPASTLVGATVAEIASGVYAVDGTLSPGGVAYGAGWVVGPGGSRQTDGLFCTRYAGLQTELDASLNALARARHAGERAAFDAVAPTLADLGDLVTTATPDGALGGVLLDCTPLRTSHDH